MSPQQNIFVTGGTGFVGAALLQRLREFEHVRLTALVRSEGSTLPAGVERVCVQGPEAFSGDFSLCNTRVVVHAAARAHVLNDTAADALAEFRRVNVEGTLRLARKAAEAGVKRFVFISSIKANGESTAPGRPYTADDVLAPVDPYGISKMEAEQGLRVLATASGMEVVIIRSVLVYGPGVRANFLSMMNWLSKGIPLPLGAVHNRRSLVALDNLVDLVVTCMEHPAAANQVFLVSDDEDLSTPQLLRRMARALGRPARLLPVPAFLLGAAAALLGKRDMAQRLCGSLQVDISKTRELLGWAPSLAVDAALCKTARYFLEQQKS